MSANVLDPSALIQAIPSKLPPTKKRLESSQDGIAVFLHTALAALGFRLIAVDENTPARTFDNSVLPDDWNAHGPGHYTFRYRHEQSSLEFVVKVLKLGSRTMINSIALESDKAATLDIPTNDFVSPSFFPHDLAVADASPLIHGFISSNRVADLISQFQLTTIQKLIPGLRKEGYTESEDVSARASGSRPRPDAPPPARPQPYAPPDAPARSPLAVPPRNPYEIGRRDLDPLPRNPFQPPSLFPDNGADGMFVGPNHPIFGQGMRGQGPGGRGPWGGDGFLPPMGAPPGARFDPVGPGPLPMPGRRPFPGMPGSGNMRDPDNDDFMPPGAGDMFM
ncbi:PI31 proteasome regulator N-terminal-domain-containing protein [Fomitopsis serialis]|uniref:PI31 proteasome regulator N-terminal-domain-containing protein n=1 Tax=Fomitopsis serialis TaxID=139415 RepID=UPI0020074157|nr:PI31 proteasome regulator N-terminal-domain-containing protein [Neoantrodia serialis]KAH9938545.1 PI31 proteasome regulator N-terminal-domain-containing protein [Neoantrodia serialis]